jgi:hypothetical protein
MLFDPLVVRGPQVGVVGLEGDERLRGLLVAGGAGAVRGLVRRHLGVELGEVSGFEQSAQLRLIGLCPY